MTNMDRMAKKLIFLSVAGLLVISLAACTPVEDQEQPPEQGQPPVLELEQPPQEIDLDIPVELDQAEIDLDAELEALDAEMEAVDPEDFAEDMLSDEELGL